MNAPHDSVIKLSPDLPYEDGSEDRILQILLAATDRSAGSDELAEHINDWPTRYHLSRLRQNLFQPFQFTPEHRVLEIGCGTGANIRVIAETGAEVVGVEGTYVRALTARTRCEGMDNVTIYAGDANDLPDVGLFDAVLLIGVLEYSGASLGGEQGPDQLLQTARKHLKENGRLILAIENQLGLKYLLSYPEDHLGLPWIGVEGYRSANGVRTWSRAQLSELLEKNGFQNQQWFYPFPDYKLPTFVATHELFQTDVGRQLVKNVIRTPVVDYSGSRALVCDATSAFQTMVDADLGPNISNSFLICAGLAEDSRQLIQDNQVGWLASGERKTKWRRQRSIVKTDNGFIFQSDKNQKSVIEEDWLSNIREDDMPFINGQPLNDLIIQGLIANNLKQVHDFLDIYRKFLEEHAETQKTPSDNPFSINGPSETLPPNFLDCTPKNLLWNGHLIKFIDREWVACSPISLQKIWIRGLFEIANEMIDRGAITPFDSKESLPNLISHLSGLVAISLDLSDIRAFFTESESVFQETVSNMVPTRHYEQLMNLRLWDVKRTLPFLSQLRHSHALELQNQQLDNYRLSEIEHLRIQLESSQRAYDALRKEANRQVRTITSLRNQTEVLRRSYSFRIGNSIIKPLAVLKRLLKRQK